MLISVLLSLLAVEPRAAERPPEWAQPVALEGVPNLHRVTPFLYRSAQPSKAGMANLQTLGVKTVIDLRAYHSDAKLLKGTTLAALDLDVKTWRVKDADVVTVLQALRRRENGPFLIHCQHGADRTGLMSAMFRVVEQGWSKAAALRELREGGYGYHAVWKNIVRYIERVDVDGLRRRVDAAPAETRPAPKG